MYLFDERIIRVVQESAAPGLLAFLSSRAATELVRNGELVQSRCLQREEAANVLAALDAEDSSLGKTATIVEHERIPFPSFPYEWPAEMLAAAGNLTLKIAETLLGESFGLKDATPYNVLFRGAEPVFVDVLSAELREPDDPAWLPCAQFIRTFVLPLLLNRQCRIPSSLYFSDRRDGIEPEEVYPLLTLKAKLSPPALTRVTFPTWLSKIHNPSNTNIYRKRSISNPAQSQFIMRSMFRALHKNLKKVHPDRNQRSPWTDYVETNSYSAKAFERKRLFIEQVLNDCGPSWVLDVGCNTGLFSITAAKAGASVVALDTDPVVVGTLWRKAHQEQLDILPLVVNLARPTPATGWRNQECPSFLERCRDRFDAVLMLALIHHMMVTERIPLLEIFRLASDMTRKFLIIEYVDPADPMFKLLVRGREALFRNINRTAFEAAGARFFETIRSQPLDATRCLYVMVKKEIHK